MKRSSALVVVSALALGACAAPSSFDGLTGGVKLDESLGAPRPMSPVSVSMVATSRPRLRWQLSGSLTGAIVELSRTRDFVEGSTKRFEATGSELVVPEDLEPGIWFWRLAGASASARGTAKSPTWEVLVRGPARFGASEAANGAINDFDGDGVPDLLVVGDEPAGRASSDTYSMLYQLHGMPDGELKVYNEDSATSFTGSQGGAPAPAISLAGGTDVNGDGIADAALSTSDSWDGMDVSFALLLPGAAGGLAMDDIDEMLLPIRPGIVANVGAAGDVDGDGYGDIIVGADTAAFLAKGVSRGALANVPFFDRMMYPPAQLPRAVLAGFDADGDGIGDIAVAQPKVDTALWRSGTVAANNALVGSPWHGGAPQASGSGEVGGEVALDGMAAPDLRRAVLVTPATSRWTDAPHVIAASKAPSDGATAKSIVSGDFNGDGLADVATTILEASIARVCISFGDKEKLLVEAGCIDALDGDALSIEGLAAGDLEGDGQDELLVAGGGRVRAVHFDGPTRRVETLATVSRAMSLTTIWPGRPGQARWAVADGANVYVYEGGALRQTIAKPAYVSRGWGRAMR